MTNSKVYSESFLKRMTPITSRGCYPIMTGTPALEISSSTLLAAAHIVVIDYIHKKRLEEKVT